MTTTDRFNCWDCGRIIEPGESRSIRHETDAFGTRHDWRICEQCTRMADAKKAAR